MWQALRDIKSGDTASYSAIAAAIGAPKAVRAVAQACAANSLAVAIPCYAAYNYLVGRVNSIVLDMEKAASEIVNIVTEAKA